MGVEWLHSPVKTETQFLPPQNPSKSQETGFLWGWNGYTVQLRQKPSFSLRKTDD
ncbi:hypothetical protein PN462_07195 [Spirulina sp. CS-785/01]|uniref:hypothetical protein n=1 Tax=Spirulina sp. CS-785/01 TaxID=3021716 RepID=UPI0023309235|nr:hypothetical protein [Spirulina sp. CS-785/01]MDB9312881.1 hypothetical protein [Spirulina sp. CS-785/01]